jgi:hypothetical protein
MVGMLLILASYFDFARFPITLGWLKTGTTSPRAALALDGCASAGSCQKNFSMLRDLADSGKTSLYPG